MEDAMQSKCQKCGMAFDLTLEGKNEYGTPPHMQQVRSAFTSGFQPQKVQKNPISTAKRNAFCLIHVREG